jgi:hypothetical protein
VRDWEKDVLALRLLVEKYQPRCKGSMQELRQSPVPPAIDGAVVATTRVLGHLRQEITSQGFERVSAASTTAETASPKVRPMLSSRGPSSTVLRRDAKEPPAMLGHPLLDQTRRRDRSTCSQAADRVRLGSTWVRHIMHPP